MVRNPSVLESGISRDYPGGLAVESLPAKAGDKDSILGPGGSYMPKGNWACALEPRSHNYWSLRTLEPMLHSKRSHCNEKPTAQQLESGPPLTAPRENLVQQHRPSTAKKNHKQIRSLKENNCISITN